MWNRMQTSRIQINEFGIYVFPRLHIRLNQLQLHGNGTQAAYKSVDLLAYDSYEIMRLQCH